MVALPNTLPTTNLAGDATALGALRAKASKDPKSAVKEVAKQFEALFMQELLKSMRAASQNSGFLENEGSRMGTEMLDAQYATQMAGAKGGLADAIARQLERQLQAQMQPSDAAASGGQPAATPAMTPAATPAATPAVPGASVNKIPSTAAAQFVQQHLASALKVEKETGIKASFTLGQAAHETGWGKREIRNPDGSDSHNLFGIKATADWKGAVTEITTTEVMNGQARKVAAKFRSYPHFEAAFADYSRMLSKSPRYAQTVASAQDAAGFAKGLQKAGYATDPAYADKLTRVINTTLRLQRAVT